MLHDRCLRSNDDDKACKDEEIPIIRLAGREFNSDVEKAAAAARRAILGGRKVLKTVGGSISVPVLLAEVQAQPEVEKTGPTIIHSTPIGAKASRGDATSPTHQDAPFFNLNVEEPSPPSPLTTQEFVNGTVSADGCREKIRRLREQAIETRALEIETTYDRRIQQRDTDTQSALKKSLKIQSEIECVIEERAQRCHGINEEIEVVQQEMRKTDGHAKRNARFLLETKERADQEMMRVREEANELTQAHSSALREEKQELARAKKKLNETCESRYKAMQEAPRLSMKLAQGEEELAAANNDLMAVRADCEELRGVVNSLEQRLETLTRTCPSLGSDARIAHSCLSSASLEPKSSSHASAQSNHVDALLTRLARSEEAALRDELQVSQLRRLHLESEKLATSEKLHKVEVETEQVRRDFEAEDAQLQIAGTVKLFQIEKVAASQELSSALEALAHSIAQRSLLEVTDHNELREAAVADELSSVYQQLRAICTTGKRDLEELAISVEERQTALWLARNLEKTWAEADGSDFVRQENSENVAELLGSVLTEHQQILMDAQSQHLRQVCQAEISLCDLELSHVALREELFKEIESTFFLEQAMERIISTRQEDHSDVWTTHLCTIDSSPRQSDAMLETLAPLRRARDTLADALKDQELGTSNAKLTARASQVLGEVEKLKALQANFEASFDRSIDRLHHAPAARRSGVASASVIETALADFADDRLARRVRAAWTRCSERLMALMTAQAAAGECVARAQARRRRENSLREELAAGRCRAERLELELMEVELSVEEFEERASVASEESSQSRHETERRSEANLEMWQRLEALSAADGELQELYEALSQRAEQATKASESEDQVIAALSTEISQVTRNREACEERVEATRLELRSFKAALSETESAMRGWRELCEQGVPRGLPLVMAELQVEQALLASLEAEARSEAVECSSAEETLSALRSEAEPLRRAYEVEMRRIADTRAKLQKPAVSGSLGPALQSAQCAVPVGLEAEHAEEELQARDSKLSGEVKQRLMALSDELARRDEAILTESYQLTEAGKNGLLSEEGIDNDQRLQSARGADVSRSVEEKLVREISRLEAATSAQGHGQETGQSWSGLERAEAQQLLGALRESLRLLLRQRAALAEAAAASKRSRRPSGGVSVV